MAKEHQYTCRVEWAGNRGEGTSSYRSFDRTWDITTAGRQVIHGSSDPAFGGNPAMPNPEDLLLSSLSACHMLWYLHLSVKAGVVVTSYQDDPVGFGEVEPSGVGRFLRATLRPRIGVKPKTDLKHADGIHHEIHKFCFIARSVNFPVSYDASYVTQ